MKSIGALILMAIFLACFGLTARADQKADDMYLQSCKAMLAVHSLTADFEESFSVGAEKNHLIGAIKLMKPLFLRQDSWIVDASGQPKEHLASTVHGIIASDGNTTWQIQLDGTMDKMPAKAENLGSANSENPKDELQGMLTSFFFDKSLGSKSLPPNLRYAGTTRFDGLTCRVLESVDESGKNSGGRETILIGPDNLIHRLTIGDTDPKDMIDIQLHHVRINAPLSKADFLFKPPSWTKKDTLPNDSDSF